jgi:hypothetical protein
MAGKMKVWSESGVPWWKSPWLPVRAGWWLIGLRISCELASSQPVQPAGQDSPGARQPLRIEAASQPVRRPAWCAYIHKWLGHPW